MVFIICLLDLIDLYIPNIDLIDVYYASSFSQSLNGIRNDAIINVLFFFIDFHSKEFNIPLGYPRSQLDIIVRIALKRK